jgi:transposase
MRQKRGQRPGDRNHQTKVRDRQVPAIMRLAHRGWSCRQIGQRYGVGATAISYILRVRLPRLLVSSPALFSRAERAQAKQSDQQRHQVAQVKSRRRLKAPDA